MSLKFDSKAARESAANEIKTIDERLSFFKSEVRRIKNLMKAGDDLLVGENGLENADESKPDPSIRKSLGNLKSAIGSNPASEETGKSNDIGSTQDLKKDGDEFEDPSCRVINNMNRRSSLGNYLIGDHSGY